MLLLKELKMAERVWSTTLFRFFVERVKKGKSAQKGMEHYPFQVFCRIKYAKKGGKGMEH